MGHHLYPVDAQALTDNVAITSYPTTVRGNADWNRPPWPDTTVTIRMSSFTTGGPGKEHGTNKPPPIKRIQERSKRDTNPYVLPTSQTLPRWNPSWLIDAWATRKDPESEWLARDNTETIPITIKPETVSHVAEQFSWVPLPSCSPPGCPFPIKPLALSAHVSPWTIHFRVLDKSPLSGPGRGSPFLQHHCPTQRCLPYLPSSKWFWTGLAQKGRQREGERGTRWESRGEEEQHVSFKSWLLLLINSCSLF